MLKVQSTQTFPRLLLVGNGSSSKAFHIYIIFYRPLLHRDIFLQTMCLQAGQTSQLRTLNCQYVDLPSLNINSITSHWVHPDVLSRWLGKGTVPFYQSLPLCQLLKWRFKVECKVIFKMNSKLGKACGFMIEQFPPVFGLSRFSPCDKSGERFELHWEESAGSF